jgi:NitT/TauT family transport system ATP-binding protein
MNTPLPDLALDIRGVTHGFGAKPVLHDINLRLRRGQFVSLVGPSGCGKSTLLRAIVGTHLPNQGEVRVHRADTDAAGRAVTGPGRDRGIVYQHYSLFPFLTAIENVAVGLMLDHTNISSRWLGFPRWRRLRKQHLRLAGEFLEKVKLADAAKLYPHELSGGMRQRVALAQSLIMKPAIILLDEPFGALDEATREELQEMLLALHAENEAARRRGEAPPHTLIIVTHELNEAIYVGDRVVGLSQYWGWAKAGLRECPGATIVYDKAAPVFEIKAGRDFVSFAQQRSEIRQVVFSPEARSAPDEHVTYWKHAPA